MDKEELEKADERDGREVRKVLRGLEEEKKYSHQGGTERFGRQ